jgi:hypothetical protein
LPDTVTRLLDALDELKHDFTGDNSNRIEKLLPQLSQRRFSDAKSLIRFHEILLFMRAYPRNRALVDQTETALAGVGERVRTLLEQGADQWPFGDPDVSGIAETELTGIFTYDVARHLSHHHAHQLSIDWEEYDRRDQFAAVMRRFLPLLEEDSYVETYYPFLEWLRTARGPGKSDLEWIMARFDALAIPERDKAGLFDSLKLWIRWEFGSSQSSRTAMRHRVKQIFFHDGPAIKRSDISITRELETQDLPVRKLSSREGLRILNMGRDTMASRFRELHGFTYGDPEQVWSADAGRGTEFFMWGVPSENRLPMLAYHSAFIFKNGVPLGYAEALSQFERSEIGLNLFPTFRNGESAWIYARLLRLFRQMLGTTVFSVDPYQLGHLNQEGLDSGAFWFYRKLGFRPVRRDLAELVAAEENKIARRPGYRTPPSKLRELASGHLLFEHSADEHGEWDHFHARNIGLAVQRAMASRFHGDQARMRKEAVAVVSGALNVPVTRWKGPQLDAAGSLSLVLSLIPGLSRWSPAEKGQVIEMIKKKAGASELAYLRALHTSPRLREAIISLGSSSNQ